MLFYVQADWYVSVFISHYKEIFATIFKLAFIVSKNISNKTLVIKKTSNYSYVPCRFQCVIFEEVFTYKFYAM